MELLAELAAWFTDPANWEGNDAITNRLVEHIQISLAAVLAAVILAIPLGLVIGHTGRGAFLAISLANIGRAVPSYAVLVILFPLSIAFARQTGSELALLSTFLAMVMLAIPPIVTNTYIGLREVDRDLVEAAQGMGMRGSQVLSRVEIPIALPVILAGLRTASVQVVATATLGAVLGGGGLGRYIVQGMARREYDRLLAGALMVALLAIATELFFSWLQRRTISAGLAARVHGGDASDQTARGGQVRSPAA
jgi:osmoprotectant transport system permease protein